MNLTLVVLPTYAVARLGHDAVPDWARGAFVSLTRTADELSVVCEEHNVPAETKATRGWRCLRVAGTLDFSAVGVVESLTAPVARAAISVFVVSTHDTDYLMVREVDVRTALAALRAAGNEVAGAR